MRGLLVVSPTGPLMLAADEIVIATGGVGGLYDVSTNPGGSFGQGLALAARAGAELADLDFVQFHPTAFDGPTRPSPLVSEAVRGEGAVLVDETGERFMANVPGAELAARDVVARAIWRRRAEGRRVFLDARQALGEKFAARFPVIAAFCHEAGIDPARQPIPVRPAAHYHMGGIAVDADGRSSLRGLWACGEAAASGLHGANRLASNSLSEAAVFAGLVADSVAGASFARAPAPRPTRVPPAPDPRAVRPILSAAAGVMRDGEGLARAVAALAPLALGPGRPRSRRRRADDRARRLAARGEPRRALPHRFPRQGERGASHDAAAELGARLGRRRRAAGAGAEGFVMIPARPPAILIEPIVRAALLEDLGRAGDITTDAIAPRGLMTTTAMVARQDGVVAGLDLAALAFRLIDPAIVLAEKARRDARRGRRDDRAGRRPGARRADRRAHRAEFSRPPQRRRVGDGFAGRRGGGDQARASSARARRRRCCARSRNTRCASAAAATIASVSTTPR